MAIKRLPIPASGNKFQRDQFWSVDAKTRFGISFHVQWLLLRLFLTEKPRPENRRTHSTTEML
jgi:hypothetical protein